MTVYYVRPDGANGNTGTGSGTGQAWQTIAKALGASGIASGDTVYIAPGTYRETVTVAMTSPTAETKVIGDVTASQFSDLTGGDVIWTAFTTNDTTSPPTSKALDLSQRDYLTFENIIFIGGNENTVAYGSGTGTSLNITFRGCAIVGSGPSTGALLAVDVAALTNVAWLIEKCLFWTGRGDQNAMRITTTTSTTGADWDMGIIVRNCLFAECGNGVMIECSSSNTYRGGGIQFYNNTFMTRSNAIQMNTLTMSTSIPCVVYNCLIYGNGFYSGVSGQLVEDYNYIKGGTTHQNVTAGANSIYSSTYSPLLEMWSQLNGRALRNPWEPRAGSWMLGFGNNGTYTTSEDYFGNPRPGGGSAVKGIGALVRANAFTKETGTVRTGSNALSITGPGVQDFDLPVDATAMTATVYVRWDATYAGTKPQMIVRNGEEAGVATATATATGSSGNWEQLSLNFTPTRAGIVTIRLQSNDTNGGGKMFADDFNVS